MVHVLLSSVAVIVTAFIEESQEPHEDRADGSKRCDIPEYQVNKDPEIPALLTGVGVMPIENVGPDEQCEMEYDENPIGNVEQRSRSFVLELNNDGQQQENEPDEGSEEHKQV